MAENSAQDYLSQEIEKHIDLFDGKRQKNKFLALGIKLLGAMLAGTVTVLLGISVPQKSMTYNNIALIFSALMTVLAAWDVFFNHKALWIRFTLATNALRALKQDLEYTNAKSGGRIDVQDTDRINSQLKAILKQTHESWEELRREDSNLSQSQAPASGRLKATQK